MAIAACNASIPVMNPELSTLVATNLPAAVNGILLGVMMTTGAGGATTLYVPASIGIRDNMMGLRSFAHGKPPCEFHKVYYDRHGRETYVR